MKKNGFFLISAAKLFITTMCTEIVFKWCMFGTVFDAALLRITLFTLAFSLIVAGLCSFLPVKVGRFIIGFLYWFIAAYAMMQMGMKTMMGNFTSLHAGEDMLLRVLDYFFPFLQALKPQFFLVVLAPLFFTVTSHWVKPQGERNWVMVVVFLVAALLADGAGLWLVKANNLQNVYSSTQFIEKSLKEIGLERYLIRDIVTRFAGSESGEVIIIDDDPTPTPTPSGEGEGQDTTPHRTIDDTEWVNAMNAETNDRIKKVDSYLMSRQISDYNEWTGKMEGMNLVYIMVEAFDYIALDPELTPTLCRIKNDGWDFNHHYVPKYSCTTGESELISEVSLVPESDVCTPNQYKKNEWSDSIFQMFENEGYYTSAYHNWKDEFYDRRQLYASSGCEVYKNYTDLPYTKMQGWPSDYQMMELTIPLWINQEKFMTLYVTSSTHFPYDKSSVLGDKYLSTINKVHPDYPTNIKRYLSKAMELDKAMKYLLEQLEAAGKLNNTAIVMFGDHHPLNTSLSTIAKYGSNEVNRSEGLNIDRGPFFIYCPAVLGSAKQEEINSTFDILPTIFNLYNINYDPRIYMGTDYFGDKEKLIYFPNGNWISEKGIYYINSGNFTLFNEAEPVDDTYINNRTLEVQNAFSISSMIFRSNYFKSRTGVTKPDSALKTAGN
ncbi:MAG: sulfatase-like hydrolase/transferase [Solobacterium sp.]|nr:sulfatase-like hydrolase/transferase [Solobacterium sp.]